MPIGNVSPSAFRGAVVAAGQFQVTATLPTPATTVNGFVGAVAVPGAQVGDFVLVAPTVALTAGVSYQGTVTAAGVVAVTASNGSGGAASGGATLLNILVLRLKTA